MCAFYSIMSDYVMSDYVSERLLGAGFMAFDPERYQEGKQLTSWLEPPHLGFRFSTSGLPVDIAAERLFKKSSQETGSRK
jgi:hypothetical protein